MTKAGLKFDYHQFNKKKLVKILSNWGEPQNIHIGYFTTHRLNYTRTEYLLNLFEELHLDVTIIHSKKKGILRYFLALVLLLIQRKKLDVVIVAFRGHEILPFVKLLIPKKPIIFDAFVSVYDTVCLDRQLFKPTSIIGKFLKLYDIFLCRISNLVLVDTKTHAEYFTSEFNCNNVDYLYVGCNKKMFYPRSKNKKKKGDPFIVFWYGEGNPLQGVDVILKTAKALESHHDIVFRLGGPIKKKYEDLINELQLINVEFLGYIPYEQLPDEINKADLCLAGHFSDVPKAKRVIPGKAFQFFEMDKTIIFNNNVSNRELMCLSGKLIFCESLSVKKIARKIIELQKENVF